ncbi:ATP-binding cassette sub-family A member 2-like isoform X3 [Amphiura filiformis]|uniref:ATP-binding cassette sub-family A member 2-like isoform X3 n=1 Tax=Amphiura filiformis TaxID=82378 RepID=UPI003B223174
MVFFHQLYLLLWKNFTIKRRSPWVLVFELFIPLVLFLILVMIRRQKPWTKTSQEFYTAMPLPSSGIIPVMQIFCPTNERDPFGFPDHPNSRMHDFLNHLNTVVEKNTLFNEHFSLDSIRIGLQSFQDVLNDKGSIEQRFATTPDFNLEQVLKNSTSFRNYLVDNLNIPAINADDVITHKLNIDEVYNLLYGTPPVPLTYDGNSTHNSSDFHDFVGRRFEGFNTGTVFRSKQKQSLLSFRGLLGIITLNPGLIGGGNDDDDDEEDGGKGGTENGEASLLVQDYVSSFLSPSVLQDVACNKDDVNSIFDSEDGPRNTTDTFIDSLCNRQDAPLLFEDLSEELNKQLDIDAIIHQLNITDEDIKESRRRAIAALAELSKFTVFQQTLLELYNFASELPGEACPFTPTTPPPTPPSSTTANPTTRKPSTSNTAGSSKYPSTTQFQSTTTVLPNMLNSTNMTFFGNMSGNFSDYSDDFFDQTTYAPTTLPLATTTKPPKKPEKSKKTLQKEKEDAEKKKLAQIYRLWAKMQGSVCGVEAKYNEEELDRGDTHSIKLTKQQRKSMGLLLHVLFSNPRILYAPNTTDVNNLIDKASDLIYLVKNFTHIAHTWLNISDEIRSYLQENTTVEALDWLAQMEEELNEHPEILQNSTLSNNMKAFVTNSSFISIPYIEKHLDVIDSVACAWLSLTDQINFNIFTPFPTEDDLVKYFLNEGARRDNITVFASLVFKVDKDGNLPAHVVYKIRQNSSFTDQTTLIRRRFWTPGSNHHHVFGYYTYGFVWIQDIIERAIIDKRVGRRVVEPGGYIREFPYPCYISDKFMFMVEHIMPLVMMVSWIYYVAMLTQSIVYEKEQRLKEVMKTMGLNNVVHWVAWFITSFFQMSITIAILVCILHYGKILVHSNPLIIWLTLTMFAIATISFCFMVSVLFSKAKIAAGCAGILYFTSYVPCLYIAIREESLAYIDINVTLKTLASLFSTTAFGLGARYFALYEEGGDGVQWDNLDRSPVEHDQFNLQRVIIMMAVDAVLYAILTWYIENVHPGSYGLPRPWYFPLQKSYWFGRSCASCSSACGCSFNLKKTYNRLNFLSAMDDEQGFAMSSPSQCTYVEPEPKQLPLGVCIENLTKVYKTGKKLAVNNLCLNMYEGQITSFLGHNGAGKTTTMSILTGLFPPTAGTARIYGHDIRTDMLQIRKSLGMCPQHNALFDKLTVEEHIWFYATLKNTHISLIKPEMDKIINDIDLDYKRHQEVRCLSGGMQRKLSIAIAFVGGSKTVILDEPTAGVDACARRAIWDLLLKYKHGRTILLSTHYMEEADLLGDRIAIISQGELKCAGSPIFLKTTFGEGYKLAMVKKPLDAEVISIREDSESDSQDRRSISRSSTQSSTSFTNCREPEVTRFIQRHIPDSKLSQETLRELTYTLPTEAARKGQFEKLFDALEDACQVLEVSDYGLMDTSLEEVFLKVTDSTGVNTEEEEALLKRRHTAQVEDMIDDTYPVSDPTPLLRSLASNTSNNTRTPLMSEMELTDVAVDDSAGLLNNEVREGEHQGASNSYTRLEEEGNDLNNRQASEEGASSFVLTGVLLRLNQFYALLMKRLHYTKRSRKWLFSQILLPAFFVSIAMSVALSAPQIGNLPELVLSPSQYHPLEYPKGNFIPYANEALNKRRTYHIYRSTSGDAGPTQLTETLKYPAGIGATCVLKTPFNGSLDLLVESLNFSASVDLTEKYYDPMCKQSFQKRTSPLLNYVPQPPQSISKEISEFDEPKGEKYITEQRCKCAADGTGFTCPPNVGKPNPPQHKVITSDRLLDVSGRNMTEYLLHTTNLYRLHRYGALTLGNVRTFVPYRFDSISPVVYRKFAVRNAALAWFSHKGFHSIPTHVNVLNNAILRANLDPELHGNPSAYGISVINHPMNRTGQRLSDEFIMHESTEVIIAIFIIVAMSFVPASFVVFVVSERSSKAKHLQFVSGVNPVVYWASNYLWDMINYMVPAACCITILKLFDIPAYSSPTNLPGVIMLFMLYGFSMIPVMYPASFFFEESSVAYVFLIVINLFTGITTVTASFMLEVFFNDDALQHVYDTIHKMFLIFPNYCLGRGLMDLSYNEYMNEFYYTIGQYDEMKSPYSWELLNRMFCIMTIQGIGFFVLTILCEYRFFIRPRRIKTANPSIVNEDEDVAKERQRILTGNATHDVLRLENLTKIYRTRWLGKHRAVNQLCIGVPQGECFGLLGVNGAGKTTTFKMLTGDETISGGDAILNNHSVFQDKLQVNKNIGYCPQFDALFDELTAREHLCLYARLKGVPRREENQIVNWALKKLALWQYRDKPVGTYSGGNKRKLSTAIALLGRPPIIFMDEPTTGMDPHSWRFLWDLILAITKEGRSVLLTSHSMEECEALCTRLAIMVNGQLCCLGSIQHLKNRFGDGYTIKVKVRGHIPNLTPVIHFFNDTFPNAVLKDDHHNMVQYEMKLEHVSLSELFAKLEENQTRLNIVDYSVSHTTLDNVFVHFARKQKESDAAAAASGGGQQTGNVDVAMHSLITNDSLAQSEEDLTIGLHSTLMTHNADVHV